MDAPEWPLPPIRPEDLPLIRGLLSLEDYRKLLKRMAADPARWLPAHERAPNAAGTLGALHPPPIPLSLGPHCPQAATFAQIASPPIHKVPDRCDHLAASNADSSDVNSLRWSLV